MPTEIYQSPFFFSSFLFFLHFSMAASSPREVIEKIFPEFCVVSTWSPTLTQVVKSNWPATQWFMAGTFLHCNEGWRKCAQCFALINGCDCWLTAKHTQPIYLYICLCSVFIIPSDFRLIILSIWLDVSASVVNSEVTLSAKMGHYKGWWSTLQGLPASRQYSDSKAPGTISMTDWPPTVCWLTGEEA